MLAAWPVKRLAIRSRLKSAIQVVTVGCGPKSRGGGLSFYAVLAELQAAVIALLGHCPYCGRAPT